MSAQRMKVLELLSEGKITAADADRLIEKLEHGAADGKTAADQDAAGKTQQRSRFLRIEVDGPERDKVNLRVPLGFLRAGLKLGSVLPAGIRERLKARGLDTAFVYASDSDELAQLLEAINVDVKDDGRGTVRIYSE